MNTNKNTLLQVGKTTNIKRAQPSIGNQGTGEKTNSYTKTAPQRKTQMGTKTK